MGQVDHAMRARTATLLEEVTVDSNAVPEERRGPRRMLLVDDEPAVTEFIGQLAEEAGYAVKATHGADAFKAALASFRPDLIAIDLAMPGMDGIELLRYLAGEQCRTPILIISGLDARVLDAAERLGGARGLNIAGVLSKPARVATLRGILVDLYTR
ncbi:MAG: response regulator, partial [Dongiaceae bacterium]